MLISYNKFQKQTFFVKVGDLLRNKFFASIMCNTLLTKKDLRCPLFEYICLSFNHHHKALAYWTNVTSINFFYKKRKEKEKSAIDK